MRSDAVELAHHMDDTTSQQVQTLVLANEEYKRGPVAVALALENCYGEEMDNFPFPDTDKGNNPDKREIVVIQKDGSSKTVESSFYKQFFEESPVGKLWSTRVELLKLAKDTPEDEGLPRSGDNADIFEHRHDQRWLAMEMNKYRQRLLNGKNMFKKAARCYFALSALSEYAEIVKVGFNTDHTGKLRAGLEPLYIQHVGPEANPNDFKNVTSNQLMRVTSEKLRELADSEGGFTYAKLVALLTKKGAQAGNDEGVVQVLGLDKLGPFLTAIANTLDDNDEEGAKRIAKLRNQLGKKSAHRLYWIEAIGDAYLALDDLWKDYREEYELIKTGAHSELKKDVA